MNSDVAVPRTLEHALDPHWLTQALAPVTGGATITAVETVEVIRTVATKVRFTVSFDGARDGREAFCLKGLLDVDDNLARGGAVTVLESDFYGKLAARLPVRVPDCVAAVIDRSAPMAVFIMRDLIGQGAHFCSALEPFTPDDAAQSLEQLSRLHTGRIDLDDYPWIGRRVAQFARGELMSLATLQGLLDGPRGESLPARTKNAALLMKALGELALRDERLPAVLVHGDSHAGNIFRTAEGPGLIDWQVLQRGGWALDVAYHIAAVLPVDVAEANERALLDHYLDTIRGFGGQVPDEEEAWTQYQTSVVYGYFLWSITRRVDPAITHVFVARLGASVSRHDSYRLLGV
jgi:hypothetical protein